MKILTLCIVMSFTSFSWGSSQNIYSGDAQYEVIYRYSMNRSDLKQKPDKIPSDVIAMVDDAEGLVSGMTGKLIFNSKASLYYAPESIVSQNRAQGIANAFVNSDRKYFYYREEEYFVIENHTFGRKSHAINDTEIVWNILPDKTTINGIECHKAEGIFKTTGFTDMVVEVWFSRDIPFHFGPTNAYGLPGLILKYKWGVFEIEATQITRITDGSIELIIPDFGDIPVFSGSLRGN